MGKWEDGMVSGCWVLGAGWKGGTTTAVIWQIRHHGLASLNPR